METKKDRKKIIIVMSLIISIILIISLATYAWMVWNSKENTELTMTIGKLAEVTFDTGNDITTSNMGPVLDYNDGEVTTFNITNKADYIYYTDIILNINSIATELKNETFKYILLESNDNNVYNKVTEGTFTNINSGNNILYSLDLNPGTTYYKFIMYIDGSVENNTNMMDKTISGYISVTASDTKQLDDSGANVPRLAENMIPIMYDTNTSSWVKASTTDKNSQYKWYDYTNKQWANAVLVSQNNRQAYIDAEAGTAIAEDDILAYYVWIPRYKYKVFNITKTIGTDSYDAKTTGIDIVFESGTETTGEITCNDYDFSIAEGNGLSETCSGTNGEYYTHPAFTFGDKELEGIWVGKFEISSSSPSTNYGGGNTTNLTVRIKPNVSSWRWNYLTNFYKVMKDMQKSGNEYGLSTDTSVVDSHMMKNMEWGAVAYLTHSDYGRCNGSGCTEIGINNNSNYITGCGAAAGSSSSSSCNQYNTNDGMQASTTGNIYGIYDMSGGSGEYVMANISNANGSYIYYASGGGNNFSYSVETAKYIDTYAYGTTNNDQTAYNRGRLGDTTSEVLSNSGISWYDDKGIFSVLTISWFARGGCFRDNAEAGLFTFYYDYGNIYHVGDVVIDYSTRGVVAVLG